MFIVKMFIRAEIKPSIAAQQQTQQNIKWTLALANSISPHRLNERPTCLYQSRLEQMNKSEIVVATADPRDLLPCLPSIRGKNTKALQSKN